MKKTTRRITLVLSPIVGILIGFILAMILPTSIKGYFTGTENFKIFSIHGIIYILFFYSLGDLLCKWVETREEEKFLKGGILSEDDTTILQVKDVGKIKISLNDNYNLKKSILGELIDITVMQFQVSGSVDQTVAILNSKLELINHKMSLKYTIIKYISGVIPALGFIGTVIGIAGSLKVLDLQSLNLDKTTSLLSLAFTTTFIALVANALLLLILNVIEKKEEEYVNQVGTYVLKNLVNRLYISKN